MPFVLANIVVSRKFRGFSLRRMLLLYLSSSLAHSKRLLLAVFNWILLFPGIVIALHNQSTIYDLIISGKLQHGKLALDTTFETTLKLLCFEDGRRNQVWDEP